MVCVNKKPKTGILIANAHVNMRRNNEKIIEKK